jgi:superfamily II DNA/RNA helicase
MGNDFDARKKNKRAWRRTGQESGPERRVRRKKVPKRIMRGACWKQPTLDLDSSDEDMIASAKSMSVEMPSPTTATLSTSTKLIVPKQSRKVTASRGAIADPSLQSWHEVIREFLVKERIASPLPLQTRCWPSMLKHEGVYVIARPGSGKTLGYLLPIACNLSDAGVNMSTRPLGPMALVLLPTRELAQQVAIVCKKIRKHCNVLRVSCLTGGSDKNKQLDSLKRLPHVVVATPGRLVDFIEDGAITLGTNRSSI